MTQTPPICTDKYEFGILSSDSQGLDLYQIKDIIKINSTSNMIEISTNDFDTYANQEVTLRLNVVSKTKANSQSETLFLRVNFIGNGQNYILPIIQVLT